MVVRDRILSWSQKITFFNKFFHTFLSRFNLFDRNWNYLHNFDQIQKFMIKKNFYILFTIWICLKFCNSKFLCFCCPIQPWILQTAIIIGPRGEATQLNEINEMRSKKKWLIEKISRVGRELILFLEDYGRQRRPTKLVV